MQRIRKEPTLSKGQKIMLEDGLPAQFLISQAERNQRWIDNPPKPLTMAERRTGRDVEEITKAKAELAEQKKMKAKNRIKKMLDSKEDHSHQRWDTRRAKWVPDQLQQEETTMDKSAKKSNGKTNGKENARTRVKSGRTSGKKLAAKATKAAKPTERHKRGDGPRPGSKLEGILKLLERTKGCTIADVLEMTGWPAISLPHTAKQLGVKLRIEKKEGERKRYYAA